MRHFEEFIFEFQFFKTKSKYYRPTGPKVIIYLRPVIITILKTKPFTFLSAISERYLRHLHLKMIICEELKNEDSYKRKYNY